MSSQKILEFKLTDFLKGLSAQRNAAVGGLFQTLDGTDPFEQIGVLQPSLVGDNFTPSYTSRMQTSWNNGSTNYVYLHSDTHLYRALAVSPYTLTDVTSEITVGDHVWGAIVWKGKYVYIRESAATTDIRANALPVASGSDVQILNGLKTDSNQNGGLPMVIGADGNLYAGSGQKVAVCTSATGTSGNAISLNIDDGFIIRGLANDGRYLVIVADNNYPSTDSLQVGNYRCRVYFWDMIKTASSGTYILPDQAFDIQDSYVTACRFLDGGVYIWGRNGMYVCNVATAPKMIRPFTGNSIITALPKNQYQTAVSKGSIYWVNGFTQTQLATFPIYAYGNPFTGQAKIFYTPYLNAGASSGVDTVLTPVGDTFWVANSDPKIYVQNTGSTYAQLSFRPLNQTMEGPYRYDFTKITLNAPLSSGQTVEVIALGSNTNNQLSIETKSYAVANPKQTLVFKRTVAAGGGASNDKFEDLNLQIITTGGATLRRIATYATPLSDANEEL